MKFWATGKSRAGIAAVVFAVFLSGCGGSSSGNSASSGSSQPAAVEESVVNGQTVALSWQAPGYRINGDQLSFSKHIDGYIVRYGRNPGDLDQQARVNCKALDCGYDVEGLAPGTWYFTVQTVDNEGLISAPSQTKSRTI